MEPRVGVEPTTCRLRIEPFCSISLVLRLRPSLHFSLFRPLSPVQYATQYGTGLSGGIVIESSIMAERYSTREAAGKLGVTILTLQRHIAAETVDAPPVEKVGGVNMRLWTARDIAKARKVLEATRPGRKKVKK